MKIFLIGTFPPPINGLSVMDQAVYDLLVSEGWQVEKLDSTPRASSNSLISRLLRVSTFFGLWMRLFVSDLSSGRVYLALSGGWGQVYDIVTVFVCRIKKAKCILHHHSVAYLTRSRFLTSILFQIAGRDVLQIALCASMKKNLERTYGCSKVSLLSNIALVSLDTISRERISLKTIGYLSNITKEKGGWDVIGLAEKIKEKGWPVKFKVAGPCEDSALRNALHEAHARGSLEWTGPLYDLEKREFLDSIDLFVFPSHDEAEPLVVWEALLSGIPVVAFDRGCISAQVNDAGLIVQIHDDFIQVAVELLELWLAEPDIYKKYISAAYKRKGDIKEFSEEQRREYTLNLRSE